MPRIRPTIKALTALPRESFTDPTMYDIAASGVDAKIVDEFRVHALQHPVLADAQKQIEQKNLSTHRTSSKAAGQPIYEARQTDGAGWRGAFARIDGEWWLVHVERHDEFNKRAASVLTRPREDEWLPTDLDWDALDAENADRAVEQWRTAVLRALVDAIGAAAASSGVAVTRSVPGKPALPDETAVRPPIGDLIVSVTHDAGLDVDPAQAHEDSSFLDITLRIHDASSEEAAKVRSELIVTCIPYLGVPQEDLCSVFRRGGELTVSLLVTHAKLLQLSQDPDSVGSHDITPMAPGRLHYASKASITAGYITGNTVLAICGFTFVPTKDEFIADGLPICRECEEGSPSDPILMTWRPES